MGKPSPGVRLEALACSWGADPSRESLSDFSGDLEGLLNWFSCAVVHGNLRYESVEHAFQAQKEASLRDQIRGAPTPEEAHRLGQKVNLPKNWNAKRLRIMETILRDKLCRHKSLKERLLRTKNCNIIMICVGISIGISISISTSISIS